MSQIHASAIVDAQAELGPEVEIGPFCIVGSKVRLGARTRLISHVVIEGPTEIGEDCLIHPHAVLGGAPQHTAYRGEPTRLVIGDRNVIREQVTLHRGTPQGRGVTRIGSDGFFMVGVHIGHDASIGDQVTMANSVTLGGHVEVGDFVTLGGLAAVHQRVRIGRYAFVGGMAGVNHDVVPYGSVWGNHAHLEGLNLIGLKRRGLSRSAINALRAGFKRLFWGPGPFQERLEEVAATSIDSPEVMEMVEFIRGHAARPITLPRDPGGV